jgi:ferritin-like metal-binding protein YciE
LIIHRLGGEKPLLRPAGHWPACPAFLVARALGPRDEGANEATGFIAPFFFHARSHTAGLWRNNVALATMQDLMTAELRDLYSAEMQMLVTLPAMASGSGSAELRNAFRSHLEDTHEHVSRLEEIFGMLDISTRGAHCPGVAVLLWDAKVAMSQQGDSFVRDAGLIVAAQRIEHYEIVSYRTSLALATLLALPDVAMYLETTLREEQAFDLQLSGIGIEILRQPTATPVVPAVDSSRWKVLRRRESVLGRLQDERSGL